MNVISFYLILSSKLPEITGVTTIDGDKKNIDGEVFNNPFQLPATRNGGEDEGRCDVVVVAVMVMAVMLMMFNNP